jgi:hypothetical protein
MNLETGWQDITYRVPAPKESDECDCEGCSCKSPLPMSLPRPEQLMDSFPQELGQSSIS